LPIETTLAGVVPAFFALGAAAQFGLAIHIQNKGLDDTDGLTGTFFAVAAMAVVFWIFSPLYVEWHWWATKAALLFATCGVVLPAMSARLQIGAVAQVGPALTSAIGSFTPLFAVLLAVAFLGEAFGLQPAAGLLLMIGGLTMSALVRRGIPRGFPLWMLVLPLGAAFFRGVVQPISKIGLAEVPSPLFATLVMGTVSTLVIGVLLVARRQAPQTWRLTPGQFWFALSGIINGTGILALNIAINMGDVVVAAPLASTTPLWALVFGALFFQREQVGARHLLIACLVIVGAVLIVTR
jgi:DME family drug/metabolite transporter